jgi:hypothetical protein
VAVFERFTDRARRVLVLAQEEARLLNHNFIGTEHILLGLIHEGEGVAAKALESLGISLEAVRSKVDETVGSARSSTTGSPPFTPRAKKVLELSLREALQLGHNYIGTEHLLLGLVREGEGVAVQVLVSLGADLPRVRQQVIQLLSGYQAPGGHESVPVAVVGPRCPDCRALLEGQVAYRVLTVETTDASVGAGPLRVAFVYCQRCGTTIAHTPAGGDEALWGSSSFETSDPLASRTGQKISVVETRWIRFAGSPEGTEGGDPHAIRVPPAPPPSSSPGKRRFPPELWSAPMPADIPPAAAVDLHHTGPFQEDGRIRGTVGGSTIELALQLPWSASPVTGTLGDDPVEVAWDLSTGGKGPATLQGTVGAQAVRVRGVFRRNRDFSFLEGTVSGTLAGISLAASIRPVLGGFSTSGTIVANGTLGDDRFEIFGSRTAERGMVRGTYNDYSVHLDLTAAPGSESHVTGACPAPPALTTLLTVALLFF